MSRSICPTQNFESDGLPWSVGGAGECTRSGTNAINGSFSMRMTLDQTSAMDASGTPTVIYGTGAAQQAKLQAYFNFKAVSLTYTGYTPVILEVRGAGLDGGGTDRYGIYYNSGTGKWTVFAGDSPGIPTHTQDSSSSIATATVYAVRFEAQQWKNLGTRFKLWIAGALEVDARFASKGLLTIGNLFVGGNSGGKGTGTVEYIWDDMRIIAGRGGDIA